MSSVLGLNHLVAPSASAGAVAAAVVTAAATSNGQPDTPPPPPTTTSPSLMREENGRSSFEHEEPKNQGENCRITIQVTLVCKA